MEIPAFVDQNPPAPNVIWILSDQHRRQAMSCTGDPNACTPNMDRMVEEGLSFTRAVSGSPLCAPFRGSLISGQYPHRCVPGLFHRMPPEMPTVATVFNEHGYDTAYFGKWHLDGNHEVSQGRSAMVFVPPERRGDFRHWEAYENNNSQWDCYVHGGDPVDGSDFHERLAGYETDALTDRLIAWLERRQTDDDSAAPPFFSVLSVQPPHMPYVAPDTYMARYNPARLQLRPNVPSHPASWLDDIRRRLAGYYAMIENLDWNIGRLRDALVRLGLDSTTHLMYFSDHGDMHGSHGYLAKMVPYAESVDIPLIVGGHVPRGQNRSGHVPQPVNHVDIAPTTLGLCGIDKPAWMPGCDYSGYRIFGREVRDEPDSAFLQLVEPLAASRTVDRPWRAVVTADGWKYAVHGQAPWLLFNLNEDPYEQVNLALMSGYTAPRRRLHDRLGAWIADTGDSFSLPPL
jgi:arylsulfatase A-like enzyme